MSVFSSKNEINLVLFENISQNAVSAFEKQGYKVEWYEKTFSEKELISKVKDAHVIGIRGRTQITKKILESAPKLKVIGAFCIGTDQIDLEEAKKRNIPVFNAPTSNSRSVVEMVIGEMIVLMRGIVEQDRQMQKSIWDRSEKDSNEIKGKTLGIVGYGNIGGQISVLAEALGMKVMFYDLIDKSPIGNAKKCKTLQEVLKQADVVTVHVDGRFLNRHLISKNEFSLMKKSAVFINTSRGIVVDEKALVDHLKKGNLKGAAIDVFSKEPTERKEKFISQLKGLPNVILTPHVGGVTEEAQREVGEFVSQKIIQYLRTFRV